MIPGLLLLFFFGSILALPRHYLTDNDEALPCSIEPEYFDNRIDHFNLTSTETYKQRYWHIDDHWDRDNGPAILHVQGESPGKILSKRTVPLELAEELHGRLYALEHRFYGISQPCKDWTLECLRFLNHHQAMADIAHFIETKTKEMGNLKRKWLLIGGSYAGALVAWFKSKYPHLATVVYSSSGVVNAITDYKEYMHQIDIDLRKDPICHSAVVDLNTFATTIITRGSNEDKIKLKTLMNATKVEDLDFLLYFTDIYVGEFQYSSRKTVCPKIIKLNEERDMFRRAYLYALLGSSVGVHPSDYTFEKERDINIDPVSPMRQWMYQVCTAYGWFQVGESGNPTRAPLINLNYWKKACKTMFGVDLFPDEIYTNGILGDLRVPPLLKKVIMVNGDEDPWKWAGFLDEKASTKDYVVMVIKCEDCSHCIDLYKSQPNDPKQLTDARVAIKKKIVEWMTEKTTFADK